MSYFQDIYEYIKKGECETGRLGLEIEHFVVDNRGMPIGFTQVCSLIEKTGREQNAELIYIDGYPVGYYNEEYSVTLEPACQFEISITPYAELSKIEEIYRKFRALWDPIFEQAGYRIIEKGNLPLVESGELDPLDLPLSPKKRYRYMDRYFRESGKYGKYMMRASASTQVSVDYRSEGDLVRKLRVLQKISPILMIMMENKTAEDTHLPGVPEKTHLLRIQEWDDLDPDRTGFYPFSFDSDFGYEKIAEVIWQTPLILLTNKDSTTYVGNKSARDLVQEHIVDEEETDPEVRKGLVEHFLSMGFYHFRIKKYIEIRVADSVPIHKALGYAALLKGIVYSDRNLEFLENELSDIDTAEKIQDAAEKIEAEGAGAVIYKDRTASQWAACLTGLARNSLSGEEQIYLESM